MLLAYCELGTMVNSLHVLTHILSETSLDPHDETQHQGSKVTPLCPMACRCQNWGLKPHQLIPDRNVLTTVSCCASSKN